jgi:RsmE family RNA methyltransferase
LPVVTAGRSLADVVGALSPATVRFALDNYEAGYSIGSASLSLPLALALGPERGWSTDERNLLRSAGFEVVHIGRRVLRVETACVAALGIIKTDLHLI